MDEAHGEEPFRTAMRLLAEAGVRTDQSLEADSTADVRLISPAGERLYEVQFRSRLTPTSARAVTARAGQNLLVVSPYVPEPTAEILRRNEVHYIDAAGNMYLRWDGLLLDVRRRPRSASAPPGAQSRSARMFKSRGLRVLFLLLCDPTAASLSFRTVAASTATSLGTVQGVFQDLDESGYLNAEHRTLHRTQDLFDRWVEAYILNLWPTLTLARFTAPDPDWWKAEDDPLGAFDAQWGGESAAYRLESNLLPASAVVYAASTPRELILAQRFRKADGIGNVEIRHRFWSFDTAPPTPIVPTPLVYADLIASADPRQREAAIHLREHDATLGRIDRS